MEYKIRDLYRIVVLFTILVYPEYLGASCMTSGNSYTSATANYVDVKECADLIDTNSDYGSSLYIPSCPAGDCYWSNQIIITKNIRIVGSGKTETYLTVGFTDNSIEESFFKFVPDETARNNLDSLDDPATFEVTGIHFYKASPTRLSGKYGTWIYNSNIPVVKRIRIHDNAYTNIHRAVHPEKYVHGVFHSNTLVNTNAFYAGGAGLDAWTNDIRTIGSSNSWYIEDNVLSFPDTKGLISGAANGGGSHVVRYNTFAVGSAGGYIETHSNQSSGAIKGGFFTEMYGNNFSGSAIVGIDIRGGKTLIFFNVANDSGYRLREEYYDASSGTLPSNWCSDSNYSTGICVGACPQICTDSCNCWKINNSYFFNNRRTPSGALQSFSIVQDAYDYSNNNDPPELVENREFHNQNVNYNGTTEIGLYCGDILPDNCTTGDGAWITTQSCESISESSIGVNPTTPISGTLYKCTDTNTWTAYYTPYTYPHPLRSQHGHFGGSGSFNMK